MTDPQRSLMRIYLKLTSPSITITKQTIFNFLGIIPIKSKRLELCDEILSKSLNESNE